MAWTCQFKMLSEQTDPFGGVPAPMLSFSVQGAEAEHVVEAAKAALPEIVSRPKDWLFLGMHWDGGAD